MRRLIWIFIGISVLVVIPPAFCKESEHKKGLIIDHAHFRKLSRFDTGTVHVFIKNNSNRQIKVGRIILNGIPLPPDPRDSKRAYWYEIIPNPVPPGSMSRCMIKLSSPPSSLIKVEFEAESGQKLIKVIPPKDNLLRMTFIGFNDTLNKIYIYVENRGRKPLSVSSVFLDGIEITNSCQIPWKALLPLEKNCIVTSLPKSLKYGQYVTIRVETAKKIVAQEMVKVFSLFPIGLESGRQDPGLNLAPEIQQVRYAPGHLIKEKTENHIYQLLSCPTHMHDSLNNAAAKVLEHKELCLKKDPFSLTDIHLCRYENEKAYFLFGEIADIVRTNPSNIESDYFKPTAANRQLCQWLTELAKTGCQPRPLHAVIIAGKNIYFYDRRLPTAEEERLLVYYAISRGAKGIFYRTSRLDFSKNPRLVEEIKTINSELIQLKPYLKISEPISLASINDEKVEAATLLAGNKAIVLILLNHDIKHNYDAKGSLTYKVKKNLNITLKIPAYVKAGDLFEITGSTRKKFKYKKKIDKDNQIITFKVNKLEVTRQFILFTGNEK